MKHAASTWQDNPGDSVLGLTPREPVTMVIKEFRHGYAAYSHTGDGSKPGSLLRWTVGSDPRSLLDDLLECL